MKKCKWWQANEKPTIQVKLNAKQKFWEPRVVPTENDELELWQRSVKGHSREQEQGCFSEKPFANMHAKTGNGPGLTRTFRSTTLSQRNGHTSTDKGFRVKIHISRKTDKTFFFHWKLVNEVHREINQNIPQDQAGLVTKHTDLLLGHPHPAVLGMSVFSVHPLVGGAHMSPVPFAWCHRVILICIKCRSYDAYNCCAYLFTKRVVTVT